MLLLLWWIATELVRTLTATNRSMHDGTAVAVVDCWTDCSSCCGTVTVTVDCIGWIDCCCGGGQSVVVAPALQVGAAVAAGSVAGVVSEMTSWKMLLLGLACNRRCLSHRSMSQLDMMSPMCSSIHIGIGRHHTFVHSWLAQDRCNPVRVGDLVRSLWLLLTLGAMCSCVVVNGRCCVLFGCCCVGEKLFRDAAFKEGTRTNGSPLE